MNIQLAKMNQLTEIMAVIEDGRHALKQRGLNQWQEAYPATSDIEADILANNSYILMVDGKLIGTVALICDGEAVYNSLRNGQWQRANEPYMTIHRLAIARRASGKGYGSLFLQQIEKIALQKGIFQIRLDTHEKNELMKRIAEKNGYRLAGIVSYGEDFDCFAYDKLLEDIR